MGLLLLVNGGRVIVIRAESAAIEQQSGARLTYARLPLSLSASLCGSTAACRNFVGRRPRAAAGRQLAPLGPTGICGGFGPDARNRLIVADWCMPWRNATAATPIPARWTVVETDGGNRVDDARGRTVG